MSVQNMVRARELATVGKNLKNDIPSAVYVNTASKPTSSMASPFRQSLSWHLICAFLYKKPSRKGTLLSAVHTHKQM